MVEATLKNPVHAPAAVPMPSRAEMKVVNLGRTLEPRPEKAEMKRAGIVPLAPNSPHVGPSAAENADGFQFPANSGVTDTNVVNHGGVTAPAGIPVQLIFWGNNWNTGDAGLRDKLVAAALNIIEGPYASALDQYGLSGPTFRGSTTVTSPAPPATFDDGSIGDLVWTCIGANIFPKPNAPGGRNYYCVFMPPGTNYGPGGALGAHSYPLHVEFPFDFERAWVAWIGNSDLNTMTRAFGHEMVEAISDPEASAWYVNSSGAEIGDLCNSRQSFIKGVFVEGYWAKNTNACVIPQCPEVVSAVVRSPDHLDVFAIGIDGSTQTAAWESDFQRRLARMVAGTGRCGSSRHIHLRRLPQPGPSRHLHGGNRQRCLHRGLGTRLRGRLAWLVAARQPHRSAGKQCSCRVTQPRSPRRIRGGLGFWHLHLRLESEH